MIHAPIPKPIENLADLKHGRRALARMSASADRWQWYGELDGMPPQKRLILLDRAGIGRAQMKTKDGDYVLLGWKGTPAPAPVKQGTAGWVQGLTKLDFNVRQRQA